MRVVKNSKRAPRTATGVGYILQDPSTPGCARSIRLRAAFASADATRAPRAVLGKFFALQVAGQGQRYLRREHKILILLSCDATLCPTRAPRACTRPGRCGSAYINGKSNSILKAQLSCGFAQIWFCYILQCTTYK